MNSRDWPGPPRYQARCRGCGEVYYAPSRWAVLCAVCCPPAGPDEPAPEKTETGSTPLKPPPNLGGMTP